MPRRIDDVDRLIELRVVELLEQRDGLVDRHRSVAGHFAAMPASLDSFAMHSAACVLTVVC